MRGVLQLLVIVFAGARAIRNCKRSQAFNGENRAALGKQRLEVLFPAGRFLGKGSFGVVRAISWAGRPAAVKKVKRPFHPVEVQIQENEIAFMLEMAGSRSVVNFFGCLESVDALFLVQERLHKDLESSEILLELKKQPPAERVRRYALIVQAFEQLHEAGIVHEDIKPENLMATSSKAADFRIIDLGLSSRVGSAVMGGSPVFNAPEKVGAKDALADVRHDIYALALTFAVLESSFATVFRHITTACVTKRLTAECFATLQDNIDRFMDVRGLTPLASALKRAAEFEAGDRFQTMAEFRLALGAVIAAFDPLAEKKADDLTALLASARVAADQQLTDVQQAIGDKNYLEQDEFLRDNQILAKSLRAHMIDADAPVTPDTVAQLEGKYMAIGGDLRRRPQQPGPALLPALQEEKPAAREPKPAVQQAKAKPPKAADKKLPQKSRVRPYVAAKKAPALKKKQNIKPPQEIKRQVNAPFTGPVSRPRKKPVVKQRPERDELAELGASFAQDSRRKQYIQELENRVLENLRNSIARPAALNKIMSVHDNAASDRQGQPPLQDKVDEILQQMASERRQVDMSVIERLKARRKEQLQGGDSSLDGDHKDFV